ncbi:hypothetical protein GO755_34965 [Spirosoma sp. HMF4905]|uniref:Uncharacterized protein n=1 Tax=Spirosoma arboris TaxID=2682092 RepID=A0A7K1SNW9_9BACT|nr:hypothetical protein [Spirosoma arboris]MVM35276.1 hypothetical protein [Spirosoma arboris]
MNTEQSYVGRGNYATPPPPMAQNAAQTPPSLDDWQRAFLGKIANNKEALSGLFDLLYLAWDFRDSRKSVEFQSELFSFWIDNKNVDLNKYRTEIRDFVTQLIFVNKLKEEFEFFDDNSGYTRSCNSKKEVGRE